MRRGWFGEDEEEGEGEEETEASYEGGEAGAGDILSE